VSAQLWPSTVYALAELRARLPEAAVANGEECAP
jgi:hypothetical protein